MSQPEFDPVLAVRTLADHGVRFVLIGGLAARVQGSSVITNDVDICYARDQRNLEALAGALEELEARLRGAPEDAPFRLDARTLQAGDHFTFTTTAGALDILGIPAGSDGYDTLAASADEVELFGRWVLIASVDDLMRMKRASGRRKDLLMLEELAALRDRLDKRDQT